MNLLILSLILISLDFAFGSDEIGTKVSFNLGLLGITKSLNYSILHGFELLDKEGITLSGEKLKVHYKITIANAFIDRIDPPKEVIVQSIDSNQRALVSLKNFSILINSNIAAEIGIFSDSFVGETTTITFKTLQIKFSIDKSTSKLLIDDLDIEIDKIDVPFKESFIKYVFQWFSNVITGFIHDMANDAKLDLQNNLNTLLNGVNLYPINYHEVPIGLGVNYTITDFPNLVQGNELLSLRQKNRFGLNDHFLKLNNLVYFNFGIRDGFYRVADPTAVLPIACKPISYSSDNYHRDLNLYLSDYTLNTALYLAQKYAMLSFKVTNDSLPADFHQINIDTKGLSQLIPELSAHYATVMQMALNAAVNPKSDSKLQIETNLKGTFVSIPFAIDFFVIQADKIEDKILSITFNLEIQAGISMKDSKLSINLSYLSINKFALTFSDIGDINLERCRASFEQAITLVVESLANMMHDIDIVNTINSQISKLTSYTLKELSIRSFSGFNEVSFDLN